MKIAKELKKIGVFQEEKVENKKLNYISEIVAQRLSNVSELSELYNEIYTEMINYKMCYARISENYAGIVYFYKNNTIYLERDKEIDEYFIHECIHYLQNFSRIQKRNQRIGLCLFSEFKILGLGMNEAIAQYITAKAMNYEFHRVNNDVMTLFTNSENFYKYLTSLAGQIIFLLGEKNAIESCINSSDKFENELYNAFEENTEKILNNFDAILNEDNKLEKDEGKIIKIYLETQELIYKTYFTKICKRLTTTKEVDMYMEKLRQYENIIGKLFNVEPEEEPFLKFKKEIEEKFNKKYVSISMNNSKDKLIIKYGNIFSNMWNKLTEFTRKKKNLD